MGTNISVCQEHEFHDLLKVNPEANEFVNTLDIVTRLDPRETFYGGRCNAVKLYPTAIGDDKIKYVDFTSLYWAVNKYDKYPIGHPTVISSNFKSTHDYFGMVKANVLPPRKLYHPVLP